MEKTYDMLHVRDVFLQALRQTLSNLDDEQGTLARTSMIHALGTWSNHLVLSPEMLPEIAGEVFGNATLRNFYLNLKFVFFVNMASGSDSKFIQELIFDLAIAISIDMGLPKPNLDSCAMPEEVVDSLIQANTAVGVIGANPWLIVVLLILAFVSLDDEILIGDNKKLK